MNKSDIEQLMIREKLRGFDLVLWHKKRKKLYTPHVPITVNKGYMIVLRRIKYLRYEKNKEYSIELAQRKKKDALYTDASIHNLEHFDFTRDHDRYTYRHRRD